LSYRGGSGGWDSSQVNRSVQRPESDFVRLFWKFRQDSATSLQNAAVVRPPDRIVKLNKTRSGTNDQFSQGYSRGTIGESLTHNPVQIHRHNRPSPRSHKRLAPPQLPGTVSPMAIALGKLSISAIQPTY